MRRLMITLLFLAAAWTPDARADEVTAPRSAPPSPPTPQAPLPRQAPPHSPVPLTERYETPCSTVPVERKACDPCPPGSRLIPGRTYDRLLIQDPLKPYLNAYGGTSLSFLPNLGLAVEIGGIYRRKSDVLWAWDAEFTWQFLDDRIFADDGNPEAGGWYQFQAGVKILSNPGGRRHWTGRWGGVWFLAEGEPNIVEESGHYFGVYGGFGFETEITHNLSVGPEISLMVVVHESGRIEAVPQFNWHFIWSF